MCDTIFSPIGLYISSNIAALSYLFVYFALYTQLINYMM